MESKMSPCTIAVWRCIKRNYTCWDRISPAMIYYRLQKNWRFYEVEEALRSLEYRARIYEDRGYGCGTWYVPNAQWVRRP